MAIAPLPNTTVEVLEGRPEQLTLPWRRWFQQVATLTGTRGPPTGPTGPAGKSGTTSGLEFVDLASNDWELIAGQGIGLSPSPSYGGPTTISALFASGVIGWDGEDGEAGSPGPPGLTGATGPQGPAGASGQSLIGPPGQDGEPGEDGWPVPGAQGNPGATGNTGATGAAGLFLPGLEGEQGEDGWSIPGPHLAALGAHTTAIGTGQADSLTSGGPGTVNQVWTSNGASADPTFQTVPIQPPGGRLTLTSGSPVMAADATAQTTVFYDTYFHAYVPVWNGTEWVYLLIGSDEISMGLDAVTPHIASGSNYDVYAINNSGTLVIAAGPAWTSTTARGTGAGTTELQRKNGIWTNKNSLTHAWGGASGTTDFGAVAANQATYLGSLNATANGQTGMAFQPAATTGGTNNFLALYNAYNREMVFAQCRDSTGSWTYNLTTWRAADGSNSNRITFLDGLKDSDIRGSWTILCNFSVQGPVGGMNLDSTSAAPQVTCQTNTTSVNQMMCEDRWYPQLGLHFIQAMEATTGSGNATFFGAQTTPTRQLNALNISLGM